MNLMDSQLDSQLAELEIKLNLAEDAIDALNHSLFRQQQQIDLLQAQIRELYRQGQTTHSAETVEPFNHPTDPRADIPPHY